jgi:hypothetical protein
MNWIRVAMPAVAMLVVSLAQGWTAEPQLTEQAAARAKQLKAAVTGFELTLIDYNAYHDVRERPYWGKLSVSKWASHLDSANGWGVSIDTDQAYAIIDHLASSGFLDQAASYRVIHSKRPAKHPCYVLEVWAIKDDRGYSFQENLGWGLAALKRLTELKKVLKGDAAKKVDEFLTRLERHRKEWEREPPLDPKAKVSPEGWALRIWEQDDGIYGSLAPREFSNGPDKRSVETTLRGVDAIKSKLRELRPWQAVTITGRTINEKPPTEQTDAIVKYCDELRLEAQAIFLPKSKSVRKQR